MARSSICQQALQSDSAHEAVLALLRRAHDGLIELGFQPLEAPNATLGTLSDSQGAYAQILIAKCLFDAGEGERFDLRARLLAMDREQYWGRGFIHIEMHRAGATAQLLPAREALHLQMQVAKMSVCHGLAFEPGCRAHALQTHYVARLSEAAASLDAERFCREANLALTP